MNRTCAHCGTAPAVVGLLRPIPESTTMPLHGEPVVVCETVWLCTPCLIEAGS